MILSAQSIRKRPDLITPFCERTKAYGLSYGLSAAGYDIRLDEQLNLESGDFVLGSSLEYFRMPNDLLAKVCDKSTWARQGIFVQNTIIEPGWYGFLTLEITNQNRHSGFVLPAGVPIAQIIYQLLDEPTEQLYKGKYQDQQRGAVEAIFE
jgi:dCTP deaminase